MWYGHVFEIITINTCFRVSSFVLLKGNIVFHRILTVKEDEIDTQVNNVHSTGARDKLVTTVKRSRRI